MDKIVKKYTNGEVTIVWQPDMCIHSKVCWNSATGLPTVFDPRAKPWIKPEGASTVKIVDQVNKCPSGALSFFMNNEQPQPEEKAVYETIIEASPNGPLMVYGNISVKDAAGNEVRKNKVTAFCRCGASSNKPFCDGSHIRIGFKG
jgi:uncharacterized Fe-S cluster protein YjdI